MSKNITISEGTQAKNFSNVAKVRINLMGGGTSDWIPEEDAGMYANLGEAEISKNGTYYAADEEYDGFSKVHVSVEPKLMTKTITQNGTYRAKKDKVDGYSEISVQVPKEGGGGKDPTLITKEITANGTYSAGDDDADGYSSVTVNVPAPPPPPIGIVDYYYPLTRDEDLPLSNVDGLADVGACEFNGALYSFLKNSVDLYAYSNGSWNYVCSLPSGKTASGGQLFVYNGQLWLFGASNSSYAFYNQMWVFNGSGFEYVGEMPAIAGGQGNYALYMGEVHCAIYSSSAGGGLTHYGFNGSTWTQYAAPPESLDCVSSYKGQLYGWASSSRKLYVFNGAGWSEVNAPFTTIDAVAGLYATMFEHEEKMHLITGNRHYSYNGEWWRVEEILASSPKQSAVYNNQIHLLGGTTAEAKLYHYHATYTE